MSPVKLTKEQILFALERFRDLDITLEHNRERLVDALVKCIILYDDKIIITTTFKNEPITIMTTEEVAEVARLGLDINSLSFLVTRLKGEPTLTEPVGETDSPREILSEVNCVSDVDFGGEVTPFAPF